MVGPPGFEPGLLRLKGGYASNNILAPKLGSGPPTRTEMSRINSAFHYHCDRPEWSRERKSNPRRPLIKRMLCH